MPGNTFGQLFRITTFGESHGGGVGVVIDGCPPGIEISSEDIQKELDRRRPGQSSITTPRKEEDIIHILSGVVDGKTSGTPIMLLANNKDVKSEDYGHLKELYRPGHADYTFEKKYGIRDWKGSGRASARETLGRVAAGAVAQKYLREKLGIEFLSFVEQVGNIRSKIKDPPAGRADQRSKIHVEGQNLQDVNEDVVDLESLTREEIERNIVRCPDEVAAMEMISLIESIRDEGDSIGGVIRGIIRNVPVGLGEPVFDKLPADLGKAMLSINAVKGFDIGEGFAAAEMRGSEHNDAFLKTSEGIRTETNHAGGTLGGISNGEMIYFRVVFKPVSTISRKQMTVNRREEEVELEAHGRHDPCVLPRAVPIVDAMAAMVIMDHYLRQKAQNE